jgi:hypothetical protein
MSNRALSSPSQQLWSVTVTAAFTSLSGQTLTMETPGRDRPRQPPRLLQWLAKALGMEPENAWTSLVVGLIVAIVLIVPGAFIGLVVDNHFGKSATVATTLVTPTTPTTSTPATTPPTTNSPGSVSTTSTSLTTASTSPITNVVAEQVSPTEYKVTWNNPSDPTIAGWIITENVISGGTSSGAPYPNPNGDTETVDTSLFLAALQPAPGDVWQICVAPYSHGSLVNGSYPVVQARQGCAAPFTWSPATT